MVLVQKRLHLSVADGDGRLPLARRRRATASGSAINLLHEVAANLCHPPSLKCLIRVALKEIAFVVHDFLQTGPDKFVP